MKENIKSIVVHINQIYGIDISKYESSFLLQSIQNRLSETNCATLQEYYSFINSNNEEGQLFIDSLQICYSDFFRNQLTFSVLEQIIIPILFQTISNKKSKEVRIWSAACAGGQESYSLSMLLHEMTHFNDNQLNYRIFATDQNKQQIENASIGLFSFSNIQNVTVKRLHNWFKKINNDSYQIKHEIKTAIEFSEFDLFNEHLSCPPSSIFGEFDIVFCANLLFYYNHEFQLIILNKVNKSLKKGGYLIVGEVERNVVLEQKFREVYPMSAIFYKME